MSSEQDFMILRARVADLERRLDFLYRKLGVEYVDNPGMADSHIVDLLKKATNSKPSKPTAN